MSKGLESIDNQFIVDVTLIREAKQHAAMAVDSELTLLYWKAGQCVIHEVLGGERADYGKHVIASLASELSTQFGRGWSRAQLTNCTKFA